VLRASHLKIICIFEQPLPPTIIFLQKIKLSHFVPKCCRQRFFSFRKSSSHTLCQSVAAKDFFLSEKNQGSCLLLDLDLDLGEDLALSRIIQLPLRREEYFIFSL